MNRFAHIDIMKAIGIVLVVLGHSPGLAADLKTAIYGFHMPLFFFISGLLLSEPKLSLSYKQYLDSLWRGLGAPYLFFYLVSYVYWLPTHSMTSRASKYVDKSWWEPILGVFVGNGDALFVNVVLWFFMCLFTTSLIFFSIRKYFSNLLALAMLNGAGLMFLFIYDQSWPRLPWGLDNALVALPFFSAGHCFRQYQGVVMESTPRLAAVLLAGFLLGGAAIFALMNGEVDMNTLKFGKYPILYFVVAYMGVLAMFYLSISLGINRIFRWLSDNTIIIFPVHLLMFSVFTGVAVRVFGLPHGFKEASAIWTVSFPLLALLLSYPIGLILHRFFPRIFGLRQIDRSMPDASAKNTPDRDSPGSRF